jgi:hypothetical protein
MKEKLVNENLDIKDFHILVQHHLVWNGAILMDKVENRPPQKSLKEPTSTKINEFVENIINKQMKVVNS